MRARTGWRIFCIALSALVAVVWLHQRNAAAELQGRVAALRDEEKRLAEALRERNRLRRQLEALGARSTQTSAEPDFRAAPPRDRPVTPPVFSTGAWATAAQWKHEGQATPRAALSTLLWAAAGGDLTAMKAAIEFNDDARKRARTWFESLPPAIGALYATPEDLVASVTIKNIPPTSAQLTWFHQTDNDHAIVGVLLAAAPTAAPGPAAVVARPAAAAPLALVEGSGNRLAVLTFHRTPAGWRALVPAAAVDHMAKVLLVPTKDR